MTVEIAGWLASEKDFSLSPLYKIGDRTVPGPAIPLRGILQRFYDAALEAVNNEVMAEVERRLQRFKLEGL